MKIPKFIGLGILGFSLNLLAVTGLFAHGGDATLVHGCVNNFIGTVRAVGPNTNCTNFETPRHWPTEARIVTDETRITNTENKNTTQDAAISAIQTKNAQQDAAIAALQGQGGGAMGGLVVKDSLGQVVGKYFFDDRPSAVRLVNNEPVRILISSTAGLFPFRISFSYTTNNCTGTRYLGSARSAGHLAEIGQTTDGQTFYFAAFPTQQLLVQSVEDFNVGEDPSGIGACNSSFGSFTQMVGTVSTFDVETLVAPFHVE